MTGGTDPGRRTRLGRVLRRGDEITLRLGLTAVRLKVLHVKSEQKFAVIAVGGVRLTLAEGRSIVVEVGDRTVDVLATRITGNQARLTLGAHPSVKFERPREPVKAPTRPLAEADCKPVRITRKGA